MEFGTLTRRVAEFSGIEAAQIDADGQLSSGSAARAKSAGGGATGDLFPAPRLPLGDDRARPSKERPGAGAAEIQLTPQALATARAEAARNAKVDRSRYEIVRSLERLNAWIARARDVGLVALDSRTNSLDPMQATLCGLSLAVAPNEACYIPLAHRTGGDGGTGGLFAGPIAPDQIEERIALAALKPLLEDPGVLKIGNDLKYDLQIFALRDIELTPYDDTMLMSYVVDSGRSSSRDRSVGAALLRSRHDRCQRDHGIGKVAHQLRLRPDRQGGGIRRRAGRHGVASLARAQAADGRRAHGDGLRDAGAPLGAGARAHGAARHLDRSSGAFAPVRRIRPARRRARGGNPGRWPASRSIPAARSSSATSCSASSGFPAAPRPRPANGRPARASSTTWPSRVIRCRGKFSTGGRCRS